MPLDQYGVLVGKVTGSREDPPSDNTPHLSIFVAAGEQTHRAAVNVRSQLAPSQLLFQIIDPFDHPILEELADFPDGYSEIQRQAGGAAFDYIRGNLFERKSMLPLPHDIPGPNNDLYERIGIYIERARTHSNATVYIFGEPFPNGIHNVHMNQGSSGDFSRDNGVYQDGGLLFKINDQWAAVFLAFQSQAWHTDDVTGAPIPGISTGTPPTSDEVDGRVWIVGALVNAVAGDPENVSLVNRTPSDIDLAAWGIIDRLDRKSSIDGRLGPGEFRTFQLDGTGAQFSNSNGGTITLVDRDGLKVHGVSYTKAQAEKKGWTIVF